MKSTLDYNIFKIIRGNRPIKASHVQDLMNSIRENNLLKARPILVNENLEVIDGQHRLEAAKILGVEIYYEIIEGLKINDVAIINSNQRNWKLDYFLELHSESLKNENYISLKDWLSKNDFSLNQGISFFMDECDVNEFRIKFKKGDFIFNDSHAKKAETYKCFVHKADAYTKGEQRCWKQQSFIRAFLMFLSNPEIEEKRLWDQIDKYPFALTTRPTKQLMLEMLYDLYNYRRHLKVER